MPLPDDAPGAGPAPRILLTATLHWPLAGRLALAFAGLGCAVELLGPRGHPAATTGVLRGLHRSSAWRPLRVLRAAIRAARPDLIVPCDDTAATHLALLHARLAGRRGAGDAALRECIAQSLGDPQACMLATRRADVMARAAAAGVRVPATSVLDGADALADWLARNRLPAVLKRDASWGGYGVEIVHDAAQARAAFARLATPLPGRTALGRTLLDRDASSLAGLLRRDAPAVTVQAHVAGVPANRAVACRQGRVLAGTSVIALQTQHATGPATVVRVVDNAEMAQAAGRVVHGLGVSGLWGLDFVVDPLTQAATLIEVNPRATPICHLRLGPGRDLVAALCAAWRGADPAGAIQPGAPIAGDRIALFPGECQRDPASAALRDAHHDRPDGAPRFVRECLAPPWARRGVVARAWAWLRPHAAMVRQRTDPPARRAVQPAATASGPGTQREPGIAMPPSWGATDESR